MVIVQQQEIDLSIKGKSSMECVAILPNGRFHLERRVQDLPGASTKTSSLESSFGETKLRQLREILNNNLIISLPSFVPPETPMGTRSFSTFISRINLGNGTKTVGYLIWEEGNDKKISPDSAPENIRTAWKDSESLLRPLAGFVKGIGESGFSTSNTKANLCESIADPRLSDNHK